MLLLLLLAAIAAAASCCGDGTLRAVVGLGTRDGAAAGDEPADTWGAVGVGDGVAVLAPGGGGRN